MRHTGSSESWGYLPALDGLRAVAIIGVVLFHYWPSFVPGGFIGVDIFFVLSGYLITGILLAEVSRTSTVAVGAFWRRRLFRLMPPVVVLVAVCALISVRTAETSTRGLIESIGSLTWTTNWLDVIFAQWHTVILNPHTMLGYMWSLAVEEQFYLVWPIVVVFGIVRCPRTWQRLSIIAAMSAASIAVMGTAPINDAYIRTDARAFELLLGAGLAIAAPRIGRLAASIAGFVGLATVVVLATTVRSIDPWMYPLGFVVVAAAGGLLVCAATAPPPWLQAVLEASPMRLLGRVSYSVYLWHVPVALTLSRARIGWSGIPLITLRLATLAIVVAASYHLVERPFRSGRLRFPGRTLLVGYLVAALTLVPLVIGARRDAVAQWDLATVPPRAAAGQSKVLVLGDLVATATASGVASDRRNAVWDGSDAGCRHPDGVTAWVASRPVERDAICAHWRPRWRHAARRFRPDAVVIASGLWDGMDLRHGATPLSAAELGVLYRRLIDEQIDLGGAGGGRVFVVRIEDWSKLVEPRSQSATDRSAHTRLYNEALDASVAAHRGATIIEVTGAPSWADLDTFARTEWAGQVSRP